MANFIYIDNSNVWIEGQRVSAVRSGMASSIVDAMNRNITDLGYRVELGKLRYFAGEDNIGRAVVFGSRPPANDALWEVARRKGFEVIVEDRNVRNREKKVDTGIVSHMTKDAYTRIDRTKDTIILLAGDGDFVPAVENLIADGFRVEVMFWNHASRELKDCCSEFTALDPHFEHLRLGPTVNALDRRVSI